MSLAAKYGATINVSARTVSSDAAPEARQEAPRPAPASEPAPSAREPRKAYRARSAAPSWRTISNRWATKCAVCGDAIGAGAKVEWKKGVGCRCAACTEVAHEDREVA